MPGSITIVRPFLFDQATIFGLDVRATEPLPLSVMCTLNVWDAPGHDLRGGAPQKLRYEPLLELPPRTILRFGLLPWTVKSEWLYARHGYSAKGMIRFQLLNQRQSELGTTGWVPFEILEDGRATEAERSELTTFYLAEADCWVWPDPDEHSEAPDK